MRRVSPPLAALIARRHHLVTDAELVADGFTLDDLERLLRRGTIEWIDRSARHVFAVGPGRSFERRCAADCLADPGAVVTGLSAARLWGFPYTLDVDRPLVGYLPGGASRSAAGIGAAAGIRPDEVTRREDGIAVTRPARTWFDVADHLTDQRFARLTDQIIERRLATVVELHHIVRRHGDVPGAATRRAVVALSRRRRWQRPAGSRADANLRRSLRRRLGVEVTAGERIALPSGVVVHPAAAIPSASWMVTVDHVGWHGGRLTPRWWGRIAREARATGWQLAVVSDVELADGSRAVVDRLVADSLAAATGSSAA